MKESRKRPRDDEKVLEAATASQCKLLYRIHMCVHHMFLQKSHAQLKDLKAFRSINEETKKRVLEVLKPEL